jgi:hypothetical protein
MLILSKKSHREDAKRRGERKSGAIMKSVMSIADRNKDRFMLNSSSEVPAILRREPVDLSLRPKKE